MSQPHQVEVVTRALDQFLDPSPPRKLEGDEALARLRVLLTDKAPPIPAEEFLPQRILVMWRLARSTSLLLGICSEDEHLDKATELQPSPWDVAVKPTLAPAQQNVLRRARAAELLTYFADGLPLLPPRGPRTLAERWCSAMTILAADLGIERTPEGLAGLQGMLDYRTCGYGGLNETQILALEELLIDEAQKLIIESGERAAIEHFRSKYGFARKEAIGLMRLARADALQVGGSSVEEDRALMIAQLKDLIGRAKEEMNSDKELKALKQLAAIQGLTRTEPEDRAMDFMRVIAAVGMRQDAALEAPRPRELPLKREDLGLPTDATYTVLPKVELPVEDLDEDEEAIAEFDKENQKAT